VSVQSGIRTQSFRNAVRSRDGKCVVTGREAPDAANDNWDGLEAAHIVPLAHQDHWNNQGFSNLITIPPASATAGNINSVQNGLLLRNDIHLLFDCYDFSINPDVCLHFPNRLTFSPPSSPSARPLCLLGYGD
jgi:HNH endonuclease